MKGGKILGKYPNNIWEVMKASGRRPVPTTPWDAVWNGVAEWAGSDDLSKVCPHKNSFDETEMFDAASMFRPPGPTMQPSKSPTGAPITPPPSNSPTAVPTPEPTAAVTSSPTPEPTAAVTASPTPEPTAAVTASPTPEPTAAVTASPTAQPTEAVTTPTQPPSPLPLQLVFTESGAPLNPLLECQGDCDDDTHCEGDLVCFQRYGIDRAHLNFFYIMMLDLDIII